MINVAYILAASHSGSTLLAMLLGSHPQACTVGELKLNGSAMGELARYRCSCGVPVLTCSFWQKVQAQMEARGHEFRLDDAGTDYRDVRSAYARRLLRPLCRGRALEAVRDLGLWLSPVWRRALPKIHRRNADLMESIMQITGSRVIIDSSKNGLRLKYLLRNPGLGVKVIHLVRDGRGVSLTYMDPAGYADAADAGLRSGGNGGDRAWERLPIAQAAREWRRNNEEAENVLKTLPSSQYVRLRYEDLCAEPLAICERLFRFLALPPSDAPRQFREFEHHVIGNGMRLDVGSTVALDERWRRRLSPAELDVFQDVAGPTARRYGYTT
ncbi:MAG: sulfotransferase [Planctomycetes bacterium]|nr:sulfotransferase [Planctomycetota bacterium]